MIYERIKKEYDTLSNYICSIQNELQSLPPGKLICCHQQNTSKWYLGDGHRKIYIPKSNRPLAEQLAKKKYLSLLLEDLKTEQNALAFYLRHHSSCVKSKHLLTEPSEYQQLLLPYFKPLSQELATWMNSTYEQNTNHPESRIHKGIANNFLRSKSEVLIDMLLRTHHIPFRYECALQLSNSLIYPDFTIRHPHTGNFFYWEHFGLMDNPTYISPLYIIEKCSSIPLRYFSLLGFRHISAIRKCRYSEQAPISTFLTSATFLNAPAYFQ